MAIYKLEEIAEVKMCKRIMSKQTNKNTGIPFYKIGTFGKTPDAFISYDLWEEYKIKYSYPKKGAILISASGTIGRIVQFDGKPSYFQDSNIVWIETDYILDNYLKYWLSRKPFLASSGSTIKRLYNSDIKSTKINLPPIEEQQKIIDIIEQNEQLFLRHSNCVRIDNFNNTKKDMQSLIDIIEPLERQIELLNKMKEKMDILFNNLSFNYKIKDDKYFFCKGKLPNKDTGNTPFLNVSAANNKINRYVSNKANIFIGDITLSLDGNTGLVNNLLEGFNGYLYKVHSLNFENHEIYYSLKHFINQKIIKLNETGTTIKHSTNSKKQIKHIKINNFDSETFFLLDLKINLLIKKLTKIKNKALFLLIK